MRVYEIVAPKQLSFPTDVPLDCKTNTRPRNEIELLHRMVCDAVKAEANRRGYPELHVDIGLAIRGMREFQNYRDWYMRHHQLVDQLFGQYKDMFYKFLAAASANTPPYWNAMYAIDAFLFWYQGGRDFHNFRRSLTDTTRFAGKLLPVHANYFAKIIADPNYIPSGSKISEFYHAIRGDLNAIPIDRWMIRIFFGDVGPTPQRIAIIKRIMIEWGRHLGWHPAEVQAALWCWFISYTSRGRKEIQDYVKPLMQRAPDIARVMQQAQAA